MLWNFCFKSAKYVTAPSIDAIFADKLSTLGPNTIGRYLVDSRNGLEYGKHIYDLKNLVASVDDLVVVLKTHKQILRQQNKIRRTNYDLYSSLDDLIYVCQLASLIPDSIDGCLKNCPAEKTQQIKGHFRSLYKGITERLVDFLPPEKLFSWTDVRESAAKVAVIARLLKMLSDKESEAKTANKIFPTIKNIDAFINKIRAENAIKILDGVSIKKRWHLNLDEIKDLPIATICWAGFYDQTIFI